MNNEDNDPSESSIPEVALPRVDLFSIEVNGEQFVPLKTARDLQSALDIITHRARALNLDHAQLGESHEGMNEAYDKLSEDHGHLLARLETALAESKRWHDDFCKETNRTSETMQELRECRSTIARLDERVRFFRNKHIPLAAENKGLRLLLAEANKDTIRLDWVERETAESKTGVSFDWCREVEAGHVIESGFRFMRRGYLGERKESLRAVIDTEACAAADLALVQTTPEPTITVHNGHTPSVASQLTRTQYEELKASGMMWEFYPDAPGDWPLE